MTEPLAALGAVVVLGGLSQWLAWRLHVPSILLLLLAGILAGPVTGLVDPDALFGDALIPLVSLAVAVVLFEGGLTLQLRDVPRVGHAVRNLVTVGVAVTWAVGSAGAALVLGYDTALAMLLGAILVVTGPTVIIPMLRQMRPSGDVGSVLRWEGILVDPVGALLAVLVFEAILASSAGEAAMQVGVAVGSTVLVAAVVGYLAAEVVGSALERYWVPDYLAASVTLAVLVAAFVASNAVQPESGLATATVMGMLVANRARPAPIHLVRFKEHLSVLLIASLFVLLAARLDLSALASVGPATVAFIVVLVLVARPLAVAVSTLGTPLSWPERALMAWMAPRGIVAAAVASVFALELEHAGFARAGELVTVTFAVIIATVAVYGLTAPVVARALGVARPDPQGVLIVGAHQWARELGALIAEHGFAVLVADTNRNRIAAARLEGMPAYHGDVLTDEALDDMDLGGIGQLLALTANDQVNSIAALHLADVFGRRHCFQLAPRQRDAPERDTVPGRLRGRVLFDESASFARVDRIHRAGGRFKATPITAEFGLEQYRQVYGHQALLVMVIRPAERIMHILAADSEAEPREGDLLVGLVTEEPRAK